MRPATRAPAGDRRLPRDPVLELRGLRLRVRLRPSTTTTNNNNNTIINICIITNIIISSISISLSISIISVSISIISVNISISRLVAPQQGGHRPCAGAAGAANAERSVAVESDLSR